MPKSSPKVVITTCIQIEENGKVTTIPLSTKLEVDKVTPKSMDDVMKCVCNTEEYIGRVKNEMFSSVCSAIQNNEVNSKKKVIIQTLDGVCKLDVNAVFVPKHNPNLTFRTPKLNFAILSQLSHSSYRDVHIDLKNYNICAIGVSTLKDLAESEGARIRASFNEQRSNILMKHDFNPDTGRPNNEAALVAACKNAPKSLELSKLAQAVQEFNKNQPGLDDKSNLIRSLRFINTIEDSKELIVQIDIDEVLTKKQKFDRNRSCVNTPAAKATGKTRESQIQLNQNKMEARSDKKKEFDALAVSAYQNEHRNVNTAVIE